MVKPEAVGPADPLEVLALAVVRAGADRVIADLAGDRQQLRIGLDPLPLAQSQQQAPVAPEDRHVAALVDTGREVLIGPEVPVGLLILGQLGRQLIDQRRGGFNQRPGGLQGTEHASGDVAAVLGESPFQLETDVGEHEFEIVQRRRVQPAIGAVERQPGAARRDNLVGKPDIQPFPGRWLLRPAAAIAITAIAAIHMSASSSRKSCHPLTQREKHILNRPTGQMPEIGFVAVAVRGEVAPLITSER